MVTFANFEIYTLKARMLRTTSVFGARASVDNTNFPFRTWVR